MHPPYEPQLKRWPSNAFAAFLSLARSSRIRPRRGRSDAIVAPTDKGSTAWHQPQSAWPPPNSHSLRKTRIGCGPFVRTTPPALLALSLEGLPCPCRLGLARCDTKSLRSLCSRQLWLNCPKGSAGRASLGIACDGTAFLSVSPMTSLSQRHIFSFPMFCH